MGESESNEMMRFAVGLGKFSAGWESSATSSEDLVRFPLNAYLADIADRFEEEDACEGASSSSKSFVGMRCFFSVGFGGDGGTSHAREEDCCSSSLAGTRIWDLFAVGLNDIAVES